MFNVSIISLFILGGHLTIAFIKTIFSP